MSRVRSEDHPDYGNAPNEASDKIIARAIEILAEQLGHAGVAVDSPSKVSEYLKIHLGALEHEVFMCLWLDNRHRVIKFEELFRGTIDGASVHPREVVKAALKVNAAAVIFAHNHPSGVPEPSKADKHLTDRLKDALALIDIRVLDHFVIGGVEHTSFAERGLI